MSDRPSFVDLGESDAIAALLAEIDAPPAERDRARLPADTSTRRAVHTVAPLSFAERPPKPEVPPPQPFPDSLLRLASAEKKPQRGSFLPLRLFCLKQLFCLLWI